MVDGVDLSDDGWVDPCLADGLGHDGSLADLIIVSEQPCGDTSTWTGDLGHCAWETAH